MTRLYLQFRMFESAGEVACDSLEEAVEFFLGYDRNASRRERDGVLAAWVIHEGKVVLGNPPKDCWPTPANAILTGALLSPSRSARAATLG